VERPKAEALGYLDARAKAIKLAKQSNGKATITNKSKGATAMIRAGIGQENVTADRSGAA
jgi:hypothetical protein